MLTEEYEYGNQSKHIETSADKLMLSTTRKSGDTSSKQDPQQPLQKYSVRHKKIAPCPIAPFKSADLFRASSVLDCWFQSSSLQSSQTPASKPNPARQPRTRCKQSQPAGQTQPDPDLRAIFLL